MPHFSSLVTNVGRGCGFLVCLISFSTVHATHKTNNHSPNLSPYSNKSNLEGSRNIHNKYSKMADVTQANKGQAALQASDYPTAITHLSLALKTTQSPLWLIWRSTAYQRTSQHALALADADNAVLAAIKRSSRPLIATAHFRRAVALHGLKRYGDARMCLRWVNEYNDKEKGLTIWIAKVANDYEAAGGEKAECNQITVKKVPEEVKEVSSKEEKPIKEDKGKGKEGEVAVKPAVAAAPTQTKKENIRHEWYQSPTTVTIEILAKGVPKEKAEVKIDAGSVSAHYSHFFDSC